MVEIDFGVSNFARNAPGIKSEPEKVYVPVSGKLMSIDIFYGGKSGLTLEKLKELVPKRGRQHDYEYVEVATSSCGQIDYCLMFWISERREWVGVEYSTWLESDAWGDDHSASGPFELTEYHAEKILQAYGLKPDYFPLNEVLRMPPDKLEKKS